MPSTPEPARAPRSLVARWWPLCATVVALVVIGVSAGILAGRWLEEGGEVAPARATGDGVTPRRVPNTMPQPIIPQPHARPADPDLDPAPADPGHHGMVAPRSGGSDALDLFLTALSDSVCRKLNECGFIDGTAQTMCRMMGQALEAMAAFERGSGCTVDDGAAERCLEAVGALTCDARGVDILDWLLAAQSLHDCSRAYHCP